jgi:hypothetical protein
VATSSLLLVQYLNRFMHMRELILRRRDRARTAWGAEVIARRVIVVFFGAIHIIGVKRWLFPELPHVLMLLIISSIMFGLFALDWSAGHRSSASYPAAESAERRS